MQNIFMALPTYDVEDHGDMGFIVQDGEGKVIGKARQLDARALGTYLFTPVDEFLAPRSHLFTDPLKWVEDLPDVTGEGSE